MTQTVVHFVDAATFGGCEEVVSTLLSTLNRERWQPVLFHHDDPGIRRLVDDARRFDIPCRVVPRVAGRNIARALYRFRRELLSVKPVVFHAHLNWPLGCRHGILAARLARVPCVVATSHLYFPIDGVRFAAAKQKVQEAALSRYIAVSSDVGAHLRSDLGVPNHKLRVVRNGVRLPTSSTIDADFRASLDGGTARPIVLTAARLHPQKGHEYLLEAAAHVPDALFLLAGDGPERARLEQKARDLGIADRVRFLGQREDVARLLIHCDLFVLPSLYEGLPMTVLEAMAAGKPVIATQVGGTDEAVVDGVTGMLVPPLDSRGLTKAINTLLGDVATAACLGAAAKARVRQSFSAESMVRGVERVYDELLPWSGAVADGTVA